MNLPRRYLNLLVLAALPVLSSCASPAIAADARIDVELPFATVRNIKPNGAAGGYYGSERGKISGGFCNASLDAGRPNRTGTINSVTRAEPADVFRSLDGSDGNHIVVYIHGYGEDFEKSCGRAALLQHRLGLDGRMLLFTWPASSNLLTYGDHVEDMRWSIEFLVYVLHDVASLHGGERINLLAHSLGARGIVEVLQEIGEQDPDVEPGPFGELVLVAPDIDRDRFVSDLELLRPLVKGLTVYVSEKDWVLRLSRTFNQTKRLGQAAPAELIGQGIDIVDISAIGRSNFTGHVYHLFNPAVIEDLRKLLGTAGDADVAYVRHPVAGPGFWLLQPAPDIGTPDAR